MSQSGRRTIHVGTRKSKLAVVQADMVVADLKKAWPEYDYEIHAISTMGDKNQVSALHDFGAKSLWTFELEKMLEDKEVDLIVHCLKDIPTQLPRECTLGAILEREDPRDALVLHPSLPAGTTLAALPADSIIGTSSVRRSAQLKKLYPHLRFQSVRGSVITRLQKLDDSNLELSRATTSEGGSKLGDAFTVEERKGTHYSALILAAAGLVRLELGHRITKCLSSDSRDDQTGKPDGMLYAVGQGALAIEIRKGDDEIQHLLGPLQSPSTGLACLAERSLMRTLEGGCSVPIGVETKWVKNGPRSSAVSTPAVTPAGTTGELTGVLDAAAAQTSDDSLPGSTLNLKGIVVSLDGTESAEAEITRDITTEIEADQLGWDVAQLLVQQGASKILDAINLNKSIVEQQKGA